jgi:hypothetical protein
MAYIGRTPIVGNYQVLDALTATTTATYALTKNSVAVYPQTPANCIVSLNGVIQAPFDSYTISGSNIVFASALTASDSIDFITVLGDVLNIGTPSDNTVSTAKLASSLDFSSKTITLASNMKNSPAFHAYRTTSTQTITSGSNTKIQFNAEVFDTDNCFDSTTDYRFTPTSSGYYFIRITLVNDTNGTFTAFYPMIYKNGSVAFYGDNCQITSTAYPQTSVTGIVNCNGSTDYIEAFAYSSSNIGIPTGTTNVSFQGFKLIGV